ncbi:MAG: glycosyltransferase family 4 protein [Bacteroidales bacterium]|nr:glycosyltransferase family 4 protein [Bacteroidales bacterium]
MLVDIINEQSKTNPTTIVIINNVIDKTLINKIESRVKVFSIGRKERCRNPLPILKLNYLLLKIQPDVIHCHNESIAKIIFFKKKIVFTAHSMNVPTNNLSRYNKVFAISNAVKNDIEKRSNIKPFLIYNSVRTNDIICKNDYSFKIFRIVQIGRLEHSIKGQNILLEALKVLVYNKGIQNINVDFIGIGNSLDYLKNLTKDYKLEKHVKFLGLRDRSYIYEHLKDYNLLIQPSLHEGFGLTIVEAMAAKVPVLVSDIGGPKEIVDKGRFGFLFKSGNCVDCANKILQIIREYGSNQLVENINAAHTYVSKYFNINNMIKILNKEYDELI